jgi:hypothetical protein
MTKFKAMLRPSQVVRVPKTLHAVNSTRSPAPAFVRTAAILLVAGFGPLGAAPAAASVRQAHLVSARRRHGALAR